MAKDWLRYDQMVEDALRGVVRRALTEAAVSGLPGDHHFYITFRTDTPLVRIPQHLKAQYPREMTIVLQHQFWGLEVNDDSFTVTLSFGGKHEALFIPFETIVSFADPSVNFDIRFAEIAEGGQAEEQKDTPLKVVGTDDQAPEDDKAEDSKSEAKADEPKTGETRGEVVSLDRFRKK